MMLESFRKSTLLLLTSLKDGKIPPYLKVIVEGQPAAPICILGDAAYP